MSKQIAGRNKKRPFFGAKHTPSQVAELHLLGHMIWYETGDILMPFESARAMVAARGFNPHRFPINTLKSAYTSAVKSIKFLHRWADVKINPRPQRETEHYCIHHINAELADQGSMAHVATTRFNKAEGTVEFDHVPNNHMPCADDVLDFKDVFLDTFEWCKNYTDRQSLLDFAQATADTWDSVKARSRGGLWFVPIKHQAEVQAMRLLFADFAALVPGKDKPIFHAMPVLDCETERERVGSFLTTELSRSLLHLTVESHDLKEASQAAGQVKEQVLQKRLARYREQADLVAVYEGLLNFKAAAAQTVLLDLTQQASDVMRGKAWGVDVVKRKRPAEPVAGCAVGIDSALAKLEAMIERARGQQNAAAVTDLTERLTLLETHREELAQ
jgi:hypothetical protein